MRHECKGTEDLSYYEGIFYNERYKEWTLQVEGNHWDSWNDQQELIGTKIDYCPFCGKKLEME